MNDIKFIKSLFLHYSRLHVNHIAMVTSSTRKCKQSQHSSVGNKRANTQLQPSSTVNQVHRNSTTINQQLKLISVTSSAECSNLIDMSIQNQQHILNMESNLLNLNNKMQHY